MVDANDFRFPFQHICRAKVFARGVAVHYGAHQGLGYISIIGQQLFGVFGALRGRYPFPCRQTAGFAAGRGRKGLGMIRHYGETARFALAAIVPCAST